MGITSFGREPGYPKCEDGFDGKRIKVTHTDRYKIITDDPNFVGKSILDALPGSLQIGATLLGTRLTKRSLDRSDQNRLLHFLDLTYTDDVDEAKEEEKNEPPDERKATWAWDFETLEILFTKDVDNHKPVANAVGEPFEITTDYVMPVLTIERWELEFDPDTIIDYCNHRNLREFWGAPPDTALLAGIRDREDPGEVFNGQTYRKVTYIVKFKLPMIVDVVEGWKEILMNRGTFYLNGGVKTAFHALGSRITGNLTAAGGILADGAAPVFLKFNKHPKADFDTLGINFHQL